MTRIKEVIEYLEGIAPPHLQESYDNSGLIVGDEDKMVTGVLCCLDSTEAIVDEAIQKKCNLIIAHHPIIFTGLKRLNGSNYIERTVIKAIKSDVAIYAIHTNLDNVLQNGVNEKIASKLNLQDIKILKRKDDSEAHIGSGIIGVSELQLSPLEFLEFVKTSMKTDCVRYAGTTSGPVNKVAVCGGSGSFLLQDAIAQGAQVFITGDFKYHQFFDAENKLIIADIGHYESEQFTTELLIELIQNKFRNFAAHYTNLNTNPIKYLV